MTFKLQPTESYFDNQDSQISSEEGLTFIFKGQTNAVDYDYYNGKITPDTVSSIYTSAYSYKVKVTITKCEIIELSYDLEDHQTYT